MNIQLTWFLTPHSPTGGFAWVCRTTSSLDFIPVGLTSKPHHDHQPRFWR